MVKVLSFRFDQCFGPFTMLVVKGSSEMGLFRHLSNNVFLSPAMRVIFSLKMFKIESKFLKIKKKIKIMFFVSQIIASGNFEINDFC